LGINWTEKKEQKSKNSTVVQENSNMVIDHDRPWAIDRQPTNNPLMLAAQSGE
jgi:hypothetical protein